MMVDARGVAVREGDFIERHDVFVQIARLS